MNAEHLPRMGASLLARAALHRPARAPLPHRGLAAHFSLDALDPDHVALYRRSLHFELPGVPLTYFYLLAQRAQLALMLQPGFNFRAAGLVHVSNRLGKLGGFSPDQGLKLSASVRQEASAETGAVRLHFDIGFWQGDACVVECASSYLARRATRRGAAPARAMTDDMALPNAASWHLAADAGRRYAKLSGDYNPIHLWGWSARLFGFRRPIIHGMHTVGRVAAEVERQRGVPVTRITADFLKPVQIGRTVELRHDPGSVRYAVLANQAVAVTGDVS